MSTATIQKVEPAVELHKELGSFDIIIPLEVEKKIRHLCNIISNVEWSGVLFYAPEGNYEDGTLKIKCLDIFPMDIGMSTYTEFDMSPDVIGYMTDNMELLDTQMGLIHSHNHMATFFSSTDTGTLLAEGKDRNHFVSLIVNNAGTYSAGITRLLTKEYEVKEIAKYNTFQDELISCKEDVYTTEEKVVVWKDLKIVMEERQNEPFHEFLNLRLAEIKTAKEEAAKKKVATPSYYGVGKVNNTPAYNKYEGAEWEDYYGEGYGGYGTPVPAAKPAIKPIQQNLPFQPQSTHHLQPLIVETAVKQLLTGSVILPNSSKLDINNWVKNMTSVFKKRFGAGVAGMKSFEQWADNYIDFLIWDLEDPKLASYEDVSVIGSKDMIAYLKKLPQNEYIVTFIEILKDFTNETLD